MDPHRIIGAAGSVDKNGIVSFRIPWVVFTEDQLVTFVPTSAPLGLPIVDRSFSEDGGDWILTLNYEGYNPSSVSNPEDTETFELDDATAEQPIDTHPDFEAIAKKYKWNTETREFEKNITVDGSSVLNPLYGTTSYLDINPVWKRSYTTAVLPQDLVRYVGCISDPLGKIKPPTLPDGRDWLKRSAKASWRGNVWSISEDWMGSGRYRWNRDIYRQR